MCRSVLGFEGCDLFTECVELDNQRPFLLDHTCSPGFALLTSLQHLGLFNGSKLLLLHALLGL
jgi:hypothetical protein